MKVRLLTIGKDRSGLYEPAVQEYARRLGHYTRFELVELTEASGKKLKPGDAKAAEAEAILSKRKPQDWVIALDERGSLLDSVELSRYVGKAQTGAKDLLFVIGGDEGLDSSVRDAANLTLSLSKMTLPHRLARVVLVEQLYRAFTILKGEPYHK
ncbi:23S rRNA (pseudouridine(1915)-N(3))-methyltransferase RlmH [Myxococcus sp. CA051A]|uniref:Ribosomal RNA large subunit methyltransferase H n=1 Tax=Myxococcus llanfairpwllgwyngyllgogerychwyrndrobwllllantysiliogogogochensis TaxID=2590453 RepID=A0A540X4G0_9BACT|nr:MULTISPECIES: 23S rRNA (pseudouridine(1915)-N(3))-methyltransferase RlmH [Myxococcus]NTX05122.1 23S rRNA (pseudouridine(1915)-N(3))-methyltransferase RlmH [Myxococcus sp. CA040A]NTX09161.1 23S rRNA (pseudouridine(1915)-N(3))-methyltransferase RlmH [Myxococcus sp. CA056]NTX39683.1 23S rRNA (pseudouridine(1915)-N(3))-methyltransferase RlmH [Myxococcus sp. CA033]NTX61420.1 23S rRNA (pseudouridine(1915)-N(3))-methyltransferase RlmH [Myxococcus sp. CA051A]NTX56308.1 23S rRNA (pseudouridine(1915)